MPVEDHAVHEKVRQKEGFRYETCQAKVRETHYYKQVTYFPSDLGSPEPPFEVWEHIEDTSSKVCRYMDYEHDSGCTGCPQPKDMEYINRMNELA